MEWTSATLGVTPHTHTLTVSTALPKYLVCMYYGETPTVMRTLMVVAIFVNFIETENKLKFAHPLISSFNQFLYNLNT